VHFQVTVLVNNSTQDAFAKCVSIFGKEGIVVFSNSAGSIDDKGYDKAMEIERLLDVPVLRHQSKVFDN